MEADHERRKLQAEPSFATTPNPSSCTGRTVLDLNDKELCPPPPGWKTAKATAFGRKLSQRRLPAPINYVSRSKGELRANFAWSWGHDY